MSYIPPFGITEKMLSLTMDIMENLGGLVAVGDLGKTPKLRRVNRIKSIHSSLAIENNTLSMEQVTNVINGKRVLGPQEDIIAVQNAYRAYDEMENVDCFSVSDLLRIHAVMMKGLVSGAGQLRTSAVGVFDNSGKVIHVAPPADMVPELLENLFKWIKNSKVNMLIKSCVFHYEFEFIHPFNDGNGRMGRLWQTVLLSDWKPIFRWIPIESIIKDNQEEYYNSIKISTLNGNSNPFIEFMLTVISKAIAAIAEDTRIHLAKTGNFIEKLLSVMENYPLSALEIMQRLNLKSLNSFRQHYLNPALEAGLIKMTLPDKPTSRNQRYYKV